MEITKRTFTANGDTIRMDVKVVALVPTRGDRPRMLAHMHRLMEKQTKPLHGMVVMDDPPKNPAVKDITYRYRVGMQRVFERYPDCDLVALIEDDDWYAPNYIEEMVIRWRVAGAPKTFGMGDTFYYHLGVKSWHYQVHPERSSAFTTFMTRDVLDLRWPKDDYSFTDLEIWKQFRGKTVQTSPPLAIGIKGHREGSHFGGMGHKDNWATYAKRRDPGMVWLQQRVDEESFEFYKSIAG